VKIAFYLSATNPGGGAKVLLDHARRLAARGHDTVVVVPGDRAAPAWFDHGRPVLHDVPAGVDLVVATRYRDLAPAVKAARGAPVAHLVQGDDSAGPRAELAASRGFRGAFARRRARRKLTRVEKGLALETTKVAVSDSIVARLRDAGFSPLLAPNGVDETVFAPGPTRPLADPPRILIAGTHSGPTKGIAEARAALDVLRARRAIAVVHLAPSAEGLAAWADERRSGLAESEVAALLRSADAFLGLASDDEGFDLPALEALATGLPCVLSDVAVHRAWRDGALLVTREDAGAVADALARFIDDDALRATLATRARQVALERSWSRAIVEVERAYVAAAGSGSR
jgi:glycosyltransferase involved in cell wall biosynthesis